jgi:radical SAM protein with 4Fe4S-binding SPASM domain
MGRQKLWSTHREYLINNHELKYLFWECTLNCNFKCKHCGSKAGESNIKEVVSSEEIKNAFRDIANNFNPQKITIAITGGEPLLRKDLFDVMEYASSLGFSWGMISNGFLINKNKAILAKKSGMKTADISIDGIEKVHDRFRNTKNSYKKATEAVKILADEGFLKRLRISTTVHKNNINSLEEMYDKFSKLGIDEWRILNVDPIGRAEINNDILLNKKELKETLGFIKYKKKSRSKIRVTFGCAHYLGIEFEDEVRGSFFYCSTGINIGSILHNGDIFVCPNVPREKKLIQGNIKSDSFSEVWNNKFNYFRNKNRTNCEDCQKCDNWNECLGGSLHSWNFSQKRPGVCLNREKLYLD